MMKCQMDGRRIVRMGKKLTTDVAAEVVGPARFGAGGAAVLSRRLAELAAGPDRRQSGVHRSATWRTARLHRCRQPGYFWAEVDTVADKRDAERQIPRALVAFATRDTNASRVADPQSTIVSCGRAPDSRELNMTYATYGRRSICFGHVASPLR